MYATAIADTLTASSIVYDTALAIPLDRNGVYRPRNDDGQFLGPMTLRDALVRSRNPVAVQLGMAEGMDTDRGARARARHHDADRAVSRRARSARRRCGRSISWRRTRRSTTTALR